MADRVDNGKREDLLLLEDALLESELEKSAFPQNFSSWKGKQDLIHLIAPLLVIEALMAERKIT